MTGAGRLRIRFSGPGSRWQNSVGKSFFGRFRVDGLNRELVGIVLEAQVIARVFREEYNTEFPNSSIGYQVPREYRTRLLDQAAVRSLPVSATLPITLNLI
jgi:transposase InsO family protein